MKKIKVGMLGYSFMGRAHSNAYNQMPKFFYPPPAEPVKEIVCGRTKENVNSFAKQFGWNQVETDWKKMIDSDKIDLFDNSGPNNMHLEPNIAAAEEGINIFCEKPLARNLEEAEKMATAVRKNDVKAMCAFNYRRVPAIQLAKKLIDEGYIGDIYHWRAVYLQDWITDPDFPLVWRLRQDVAGSGPHGDLNAHIVDLSQYLLGGIKEVIGMEKTFIKERPLPSGAGVGLGDHTASEERKMGKVTVDDAVLFLAKFNNGALGSFEATRFATGRRNYNCFEINGSKGSIVWNLERMNELEFYSSEDPAFAQGFRTINVTEGIHPYVNKWWPSGHIIGWEHTFTHEVYDFFNAIAKDLEIHPNFDDAVKVQRVLEHVKDSIKSNSWKSC
ncbi:MAG: gfo/Idh/MocA family oxidoreductase [Candidatus Lokiarchaeota archaeon]|nr:gfo/Idh/MocA family oxidoreductase [Candidatus Lokiarchaeota archaeon]